MNEVPKMEFLPIWLLHVRNPTSSSTLSQPVKQATMGTVDMSPPPDSYRVTAVKLPLELYRLDIFIFCDVRWKGHMVHLNVGLLKWFKHFCFVLFSARRDCWDLLFAAIDSKFGCTVNVAKTFVYLHFLTIVNCWDSLNIHYATKTHTAPHLAREYPNRE